MLVGLIFYETAVDSAGYQNITTHFISMLEADFSQNRFLETVL
jgi:hypothetical protein